MARTTLLDYAALEKTLLRQRGVIARRQAEAVGMTHAALAHRLRPGGPWQICLPGVYLGFTGPVTDDHRLLAALLYAGPDGVLTGTAALRCHRLPAPDPGVVEVLVPRKSRRQSAAFTRVQHTSRMPVPFCVSGELRYAMVARAVADTARALQSLRDVRAVVSGVVQKGRCPIGLLADEAATGPVQGSRLLRTAIAEAAVGIRSASEADLRDLIRRARLPMPMFNARIFDGRAFLAAVDAWWPQAGVAAEVDSREWHLSAEDWQRTMRRHDRLIARGILVLHFSPQRIRNDPRAVTAEIRAALNAGTARTAPCVRAMPASG